MTRVRLHYWGGGDILFWTKWLYFRIADNSDWVDQSENTQHGFGSGIEVAWSPCIKGLLFTKSKRWCMNWISAEKMFNNIRIYET